MSSLKNLSSDDIALFRAAVGDVKPLTNRRAGIRTPPTPLRPRFHEADEHRVMMDALSGVYHPDDWETGDEIAYFRTGIQDPVRRRLRRGQYAVGAELDLHGMTVPVARRALAGFLQTCMSSRVRCVRVIHGKGRGSYGRQPILKQKVNHWLRQWDVVLGFCTCKPYDGGTGAVYVLLRGRR